MPKIDRFEGEYAFLSNFYPYKIVYEGLVYNSSEHAYQAAKATTADDIMKTMACKTPGQAKRMGRKIKIREDWEQIKIQVMTDIVRTKFKYPELVVKLLETGNAELIEGNDHRDSFWGVYRGSGSNHLGKILMQIRKELHNVT